MLSLYMYDAIVMTPILLRDADGVTMPDKKSDKIDADNLTFSGWVRLLDGRQDNILIGLIEAMDSVLIDCVFGSDVGSTRIKSEYVSSPNHIYYYIEKCVVAMVAKENKKIIEAARIQSCIQ